MGDRVALLTLTSAYMEGNDVINVEIQIIGHKHYKPSAALWIPVEGSPSPFPHQFVIWNRMHYRHEFF